MKESELIPTREYIEMICRLYDFSYDDRTRAEWIRVGHDHYYGGKRYISLHDFQEQLREKGIIISSSKIRKILISGGCYSTRTSRAIGERFETLTRSVEQGGEGMEESQAVRQIAREMERDPDGVYIYVPYKTTMHSLLQKSKNAVRIDRCRKRKKDKSLREQG